MIFEKNLNKEIIDKYQYFIFDIWGVIHDGSQLYPLVLEKIEHLRNLGKNICFLSNAPRRASKTADVLNNFGIKKEFYDFILTSGEATYSFLSQTEEQLSKSELKNFIKNKLDGRYNYYYIGPKKDEDLLSGLEYLSTTDASQAHFVVATGFNNDLSKLEEKMPQLQEAKKHNLAMICVNPDLIVVKQNGLEIICAGLMALEYQKMGGKVIYFGKPYNLVYKQVFQLFNLNKDLSRVLAIGDGLETDILGANQNGIDSALIAGGILSSVFKIKYGQLPEEALLNKLCQQKQCFPQFVIGSI